MRRGPRLDSLPIVKVVANGKLDGVEVVVVWQDGGLVAGPREARLAIISKSATLTGREIGHPELETISYDYLRKPFGFVEVASMVLQGARFTWPEGRPIAPGLSPGAIG